MSQPLFDIVVFGATSFVGQIISRYLLETYPEQTDIRWALAARSETKLDALKASLGAAAAPLQLIVADADDEEALTALCEQTRVVISTVGPYDLYGDTLVKVCTATGTDYCDLAGEVRWMRRVGEQYQAAAETSGARIVHCCGFDSLPSDMGVSFLQACAKQTLNQYCSTVTMRVVEASGTFSGGTIATLLNEAKALKADPALRAFLDNPYVLCPTDYDNSTAQALVTGAEYDSVLGTWIMPSLMAEINQPVVFRSQALLGNPYGEHFSYNEAVATSVGMKGQVIATLASGAIKLFVAATKQPRLRALLQRFVLPAPGEGPSEAAQFDGYYDLRFFGRTDDGQQLEIQLTGDRDPGYGSTAKMLVQSAVSLIKDVPPSDKAGGFWTPASIFDQRLIDRLTALAGMTFKQL